MSDDEVDHELLDLLRKSLGLGPKDPSAPPETKVLQDAEFVYDNSIDVALDMRHTKVAAIEILEQMQERQYSTKIWSEHPLHPKAKDESTVNFIFAMDLLNFSFWSEKGEDDRFALSYREKKWTGYWSLVAALQRALDENIPITTPSFWIDEEKCSEEVLRKVFRSETDEDIPMFAERVQCLREAGQILEEVRSLDTHPIQTYLGSINDLTFQEFDSSVITLIEDAKGSAAGLVNLLAERFPCFKDEARFEKKKVRFLKRAQIFVADLWAAFEGEGYGNFKDIDKITMFAGISGQLVEIRSSTETNNELDYRIPQMLHSLGCMSYCPPLEGRIRRLEPIPQGHSWELQIRGRQL